MPTRASSEPSTIRVWQYLGIIASVGGVCTVGAGLSFPLLHPAPVELSSFSQLRPPAASVGTPTAVQLQVLRRNPSPLPAPAEPTYCPQKATNPAVGHLEPEPWTQFFGPKPMETEGPWYGEGRHPTDTGLHSGEKEAVTRPTGLSQLR